MENNNEILWISHSGLLDFKNCPRAYYLKHIYRNPATGNKIRVVNPFLTLGTAVHYVLENLAQLAPESRFYTPLTDKLEQVWPMFRGKKGGFDSWQKERYFKKRGLEMLRQLEQGPGLMLNHAHILPSALPKLRLFSNQEIILVGSIDWIEKLPNGEAHIVDFKTSQTQEPQDSLQLPIYLLLAQYHLKIPVTKTSYWYLEQKNGAGLQEVSLRPASHYINVLRKKSLHIKQALENGLTESCGAQKKSACDCYKYEQVLNSQAQYVGFDSVMSRDLFYL